MRQFPIRRRRQARIEIIPMTDVMMFLFVFFVHISQNVLPALGLHVTLPGSRGPDRVSAPRRLTITIEKNGDLELDGARIDTNALPVRLAALHSQDPRLQVIIAGDHEADPQHLVDVLDALKQAGIPAAAIITRTR